MSTMVDSKMTKSFSKSIGRAKEKILQNLGKVDRTADEIFDEHVSNFNKQQCAATRLQKELNNYIRCIRACANANRSLMEAVSEVYEPEWGGKEILALNSQTGEMLWNDFGHRLAEQVLIPLNTYQGQFPEMRKKIEKRGRKLVDFDGERHGLQALQSNPRRAEAKLSKQRENLEGAKRTYEVLNSELHEELPALYGSRIVFLVSSMSTLFASENIFHSESSKIYTELEGVVERLAKESAKGALNFKSSNAILNNSAHSDSQKDGDRSSPSRASPSGVKSSEQVVAELADGAESLKKGPSPTSSYTMPMPGAESPTPPTNSAPTSPTTDSAPTTLITTKLANGMGHPVELTTAAGTATTTVATNGNGNGNGVAHAEEADDDSVDGSSSGPGSKPSRPTSQPLSQPQRNGHAEELPSPTGTGNDKTNLSLELKSANPSSMTPRSPTDTPVKSEVGVLYRVRATYRYQKEDVDELSFDAGEIIRVVEYDDPEEQEEGWLMGIKDNGEKGMFPANFTRPL